MGINDRVKFDSLILCYAVLVFIPFSPHSLFVPPLSFPCSLYSPHPSSPRLLIILIHVEPVKILQVQSSDFSTGVREMAFFHSAISNFSIVYAMTLKVCFHVAVILLMLFFWSKQQSNV